MCFPLHWGCRSAQGRPTKRRSGNARSLASRLRFASFLSSENATAATEYAVLTAVIAIGVLIAMGGFGDSLNRLYLAILAVADSIA